MKRNLLLTIAACAFFIPSVVFAKAPEYVEAEGGEALVAENTSVFGGSHNSDEAIESSSITMNGGTVKNVIGGGLHKSIVKKATIIMNNGTITGSLMGGGAQKQKINTDGDFIYYNV